MANELFMSEQVSFTSLKDPLFLTITISLAFLLLLDTIMFFYVLKKLINRKKSLGVSICFIVINILIICCLVCFKPIFYFPVSFDTDELLGLERLFSLMMSFLLHMYIIVSVINILLSIMLYPTKKNYILADTVIDSEEEKTSNKTNNNNLSKPKNNLFTKKVKEKQLD